jgi:hypothetical protein
VICSVARMLASLGVQARVVAVDINPEAAAATQRTLENHGVRPSPDSSSPPSCHTFLSYTHTHTRTHFFYSSSLAAQANHDASHCRYSVSRWL